MSLMVRLLFVWSILLLSYSNSLADPPDQREIIDFEHRVRMVHGFADDLDLLEFYQQEIARLKVSPPTPENIRDLADIYHSAGHFAEHQHDFLLAINYHQSSIPLYKANEANGLQITGSWDGVEHAFEHIFMDLYDQGILLGWDNKLEEAMVYFQKAFEFAEVYNLAERLIVTPRFPQRYLPLLQYFAPEKAQSFIPQYITSLLLQGVSRHQLMGLLNSDGPELMARYQKQQQLGVAVSKYACVSLLN